MIDCLKVFSRAQIQTTLTMMKVMRNNSVTEETVQTYLKETSSNPFKHVGHIREVDPEQVFGDIQGGKTSR